MISKKYPVEVLEERLKYERESLEDEQEHIKTLKAQAAREEGQLMPTIACITGLEDAIHKLKGLDNLEKKNKIADPAGFVVKDVPGFDIHKFARDLILPDIIEYLKSSRISFIAGGKLK